MLVEGRALVAPLPFMKNGSSTDQTVPHPDVDHGRSGRASSRVMNPPVFVEGKLTELAGPGLLIEAPLPVQTGDRILVIFTLNEHGGNSPMETNRTIAGIGAVRHCRSTDQKTLIAVELTGLSDAEVDELAFITGRISSDIDARNESGRSEMREAAAHAVAAM